jgi:hypothetical protein
MVCAIGPFDVLLAIVEALAEASANVLALIELGVGVWLVCPENPVAIVDACPYATAANVKHEASEQCIFSRKERYGHVPYKR